MDEHVIEFIESSVRITHSIGLKSTPETNKRASAHVKTKNELTTFYPTCLTCIRERKSEMK